MNIEHEWAFIFCKIKDWRLIPVCGYHKESWPKIFQFHWLFFYCHRIERIKS
jgi:hypothetical protein